MVQTLNDSSDSIQVIYRDIILWSNNILTGTYDKEINITSFYFLKHTCCWTYTFSPAFLKYFIKITKTQIIPDYSSNKSSHHRSGVESFTKSITPQEIIPFSPKDHNKTSISSPPLYLPWQGVFYPDKEDPNDPRPSEGYHGVFVVD